MRPFSFYLMVAVLSLPAGLFAQENSTPATSDKEPSSSAAAGPSPSFKSYKEAYTAGNEALKAFKYDEAIADYGAAEQLGGNSKRKGLAANALGWVYFKARKLEEAKKAFGEAIEADPDNKIALKNMGVVCFRLYEYGFSGVEELKEAIKDLTASGEDEELLERAKGAQSREEGYAQVTPEPVPDLSTMKFKELLALGDKVQSEGRFDDALKIFKQAAAVAVSSNAKGTAANRQGKVLLDARRPHESVAYFEEAVKDQPKEKVFLNNLGYSYLVLYYSGKGKEDDLKKAVDAFYQMNSIDPSYHNENLATALDELKEVNPEAAKAYSVKDESTAEGEKAAGDDSTAKPDDSAKTDKKDDDSK
jgi:tetratricopeptide (TPR) repeat protein